MTIKRSSRTDQETHRLTIRWRGGKRGTDSRSITNTRKQTDGLRDMTNWHRVGEETETES